MQKARVFDRSSTNNHIAQTGVQVALNGIQIADTTTELHIDLAAHLFQDLADGRFILRVAGKRAVQIHQMQAPRPFVHPAARHDRRVFAKSGGLVHIALFQANTVAVFEVNRGN